MHKGIRHKSRKNKSRKNKSRKYRGGMGATEYVAGMYGNLDQQMAGANENHMQLTPLTLANSQSGGKSRRKGKVKGKKSFRLPNQESSSRLAGGDSTEEKDDDAAGGNYLPLNPAEYSGPVGELSDGQKGGYMMQLLERAAVPFGLMALRNYAGKYSKKNRKNKK
jgi:hypothetical protein